MRSKAPPLLPVLRSRLQGEVLALLVIDPDREWSVSELAHETGSALTSVQSEVHRLLDGDVLSSRKIGRTRLVKINRANPICEPLSQMIMIAFGPVLVLREAFSGLGISTALIFGSWAARLSGHSGAAPGDVDVLIVADDVKRDRIYEAAERCESRLSLQVNPVVRSTAAFRRSEEDPLISEVLNRPHVELSLEVGGSEHAQ